MLAKLVSFYSFFLVIISSIPSRYLGYLFPVFSRDKWDSSRVVEPELGVRVKLIWDGWNRSRSQRILMVEPEPEIWVPVPQT